MKTSDLVAMVSVLSGIAVSVGGGGGADEEAEEAAILRT